MSDAVARWRVLTSAELAVERDARFGGAIAVIFYAAAFALLPVAFLIVSAVRDPNGTTWVVLMMLRQAFGGDMKSGYMASSLVQMLMLLVWAATFITVTLARTRSGPAVAAVAFAFAALVGPVGQCATIIAFSPGTAGIFAAAVQLPHTVLNLAAAVAFWAYMREGRRPNLYFRRRVQDAAGAADDAAVRPADAASV